VPFSRHPESIFLLLFLPLSPSVFKGVRISSDTEGVILSGAFPREDLIFYIFFFINALKDEIATSHQTLLAMTGRSDEIATSLRSSQ
jgi:hypothetical protein